jgi:cytochrome d ubiquinol oxidase subunit I
MAVSLAFHIVFAVIGVAMPVLMVMAGWRWRRTGHPVYQDLARQWARGTAVFFAVGAVSGTVLSFELGLLWPEFMRHAGAIIGMPFSLEGLAFFIEAIFLGIYLYGFDRLPPRLHLAAGGVAAVSGAASAVTVMAVNAWMNAPTGFTLKNGFLTDVDPIHGMLNSAWGPMALHMILGALVAVGFGVAGIHAWRLRHHKRPEFHRAALGISLSIAAPAAILQLLSGDVIARHVAVHQPIKLAALEGQFETQARAPVRLGGLPSAQSRRMVGAIEVPAMLSLLTHHDPNATIQGLNEFPADQWPPLIPVRIAWQVMIACGLALAGVSVFSLWRRWRRRAGWLDDRRFLGLLAVCAPLGFVALEAGWVVTEVGRQPWIIYRVMRTADAVTPMPHLVLPFLAISALYLLLAIVVLLLMRRIILLTSPHTPLPTGEGHNSSAA